MADTPPVPLNQQQRISSLLLEGPPGLFPPALADLRRHPLEGLVPLVLPMVGVRLTPPPLLARCGRFRPLTLRGGATAPVGVPPRHLPTPPVRPTAAPPRLKVDGVPVGPMLPLLRRAAGDPTPTPCGATTAAVAVVTRPTRTPPKPRLLPPLMGGLERPPRTPLTAPAATNGRRRRGPSLL